MAEFGEGSAASCAALSTADREQTKACDEAFSALVKRQSQSAFRVAFSVLRNVQDAEDTVQEAFLKLYRLGKRSQIKDEKAFLARTTWRLAVSRLKRTEHSALVDDAPDSAANIEATLVKADIDAALHRLIDALPLDLRLPLALSTVDEMSSPQIAKVMGIAEGTVRTRLLRAREMLKQTLTQQEARCG